MAAIQWFTPREVGSPWVSKSADGYYAIAQPVMGSFGAYNVPMLWHSPVPIGAADTIKDAQELCEQHRRGMSSR